MVPADALRHTVGVGVRPAPASAGGHLGMGSGPRRGSLSPGLECTGPSGWGLRVQLLRGGSRTRGGGFLAAAPSPAPDPGRVSSPRECGAGPDTQHGPPANLALSLRACPWPLRCVPGIGGGGVPGHPLGSPLHPSPPRLLQSPENPMVDTGGSGWHRDGIWRDGAGRSTEHKGVSEQPPPLRGCLLSGGLFFLPLFISRRHK